MWRNLAANIVLNGPIYKYLPPHTKKPQYWPPHRQSISVVFKISLFRASHGGPLPFSFSVLFTELEAVSTGGTKRKEGTNGVKKKNGKKEEKELQVPVRTC